VQERTALAIFCGSMPTIPPEVLGEQTYQGMPMDAWNLGVVVLEAVGGVGVMQEYVDWASVNYDEFHERQTLAERIRDLFADPTKHDELMGRSRQRDIPTEVRNVVVSLVEPRVAARGTLQQHLPDGSATRAIEQPLQLQ